MGARRKFFGSRRDQTLAKLRTEMTMYARLIAILWLVLLGYWVIAAGTAKRNVGARAWWQGTGLRLGVIVLVLVSALSGRCRLL